MPRRQSESMKLDKKSENFIFSFVKFYSSLLKCLILLFQQVPQSIHKRHEKNRFFYIETFVQLRANFVKLCGIISPLSQQESILLYSGN